MEEIFEVRARGELYDEKLQLMMNLGESSVGEMYSHPTRYRAGEAIRHPAPAMLRPGPHRGRSPRRDALGLLAGGQEAEGREGRTGEAATSSGLSALHSVNYHKMDPKKVEELIAKGVVHFKFCIEFYTKQMLRWRGAAILAPRAP